MMEQIISHVRSEAMADARYCEGVRVKVESTEIERLFYHEFRMSFQKKSIFFAVRIGASRQNQNAIKKQPRQRQKTIMRPCVRLHSA
jgi:hypothetical protein